MVRRWFLMPTSKGSSPFTLIKMSSNTLMVVKKNIFFIYIMYLFFLLGFIFLVNYSHIIYLYLILFEGYKEPLNFTNPQEFVISLFQINWRASLFFLSQNPNWMK